jgi:hypothetical protein
LLDLLERGPRVVHQALASLGQAQAAGGALHQGDFGSTLQLGNALAHGGLAHTQSGGRCRVAALLGQHAQPVQVRPEGTYFLFIHACIVHDFEQSIQVFDLVRGCRGA